MGLLGRYEITVAQWNKVESIQENLSFCISFLFMEKRNSTCIDQMQTKAGRRGLCFDRLIVLDAVNNTRSIAPDAMNLSWGLNLDVAR